MESRVLTALKAIPRGRPPKKRKIRGEITPSQVFSATVSTAALATKNREALVVLVLLVILLVLWAKVFRRNRRYGSRSGRRYRSSSYRGGRRGR